ncbi:acyl carrier protein [Mucilaginibacter gynuensis]|uniref:Acyl carrier protein n=1 Tax=Mucilaginibacter gynuensis TaxID=1302236 RepID=A0ABP8G845_9SPHI
MNKEQILAKVTDIFKDVLDNDDIVLTDTTVATDVEDWDSLNHIQIIVAIEKSFKIKFTSTEIHHFKNVGELIGSIESKLS